MNARIVERPCDDCQGNGMVYHFNILDPQQDTDEPCGTCFGFGTVEHISYG